MKKFLPLIILLLGILVFVGLYIFVIKPKGQDVDVEDEALIEVPLGERPIVTLTPSEDGHWLTLSIEKVVVSDVATLDYLLLYDLPDGRQQGVPGSIDLGDGNSIERELLLGSESSGKFRYDEGVKEGSIEVKYRNNQGKTIAKFESGFHLQNNTQVLTSQDGNVEIDFNKKLEGYFVTMSTFGMPGNFAGEIKYGPFGVFGTTETNLEGEYAGEGVLYYWNGEAWEKVNDNRTTGLGIFIITSE